MNLQNLIDYCQGMGKADILSGVVLPAPLDSEKCKTAIVMRCGLLTPVYGEPDMLREMIRDWFSARQWNFEHLIKVIQAEYSPIENTDKYSEHTIERDGSNRIQTGGSDITTHSGSDTNRLSGTDATASTGNDTTTLSGTDAIASTGNDTTTLSGTDAIASTGTDTRTRTPNLTNTQTSEISAENASTYQPDTKVTTTDNGTETDAMQHGKTDTTTYGKRETLQHGKTDTTTYGKRETLQHGKTDTTTYGKTDTLTYGKQETLQHGKSEFAVNDGKESYTEHTHGNIGVTTNTTLISEELSLIKRFNAYDWIAERIEEQFFIMVY